VGLVFQEPRLLPWLTVADNVGFGLDGVRRPERRARVAHALERVGLSEHAARWPRDLSGGQQQRVSIARAFVARPRVLLLDEPFSALDAFTRKDLHGHLLALWAETRPTILIVTHDVGEAVALADRAVVMRPKPGRLDETVRLGIARPRDPASPQSEASTRAILAALDRSLRPAEAQAAAAPAGNWW
jgi:sulfonate transport system ATP-binding protein